MNPMFNLDLLSFALSSIPFGLSIWNPKLRSFIWTEAQATIHGLHLNQFDGRLESFLQTIHPHDVEFVRDFFTDIEYPEPDIGLRPYRILDGNGHTRWIQIHFHWIDDPYLLITAQDVTEDRNICSAFIQANFQRRFWLDHSQDFILILHDDRSIQECSQACFILLGTDAVIRRPIGDFIYSDDRAIVSQLLQDCDNQPKSLLGVRIHILDLAVGWFNLWWQGDRERRQGTLLLKPQQQMIQRSPSRRARRTPSDRS
jgi:PAS domain-containing protein